MFAQKSGFMLPVHLKHYKQHLCTQHLLKRFYVVFVPMVSGSCWSMFEESSKSSKASQPEMSASTVSMRFFAKSKYRNWRNFPIDCTDRTQEEDKIKSWIIEQMVPVTCESFTPGIFCRELLSNHSSFRLWICSNTSG